MNDIIVRQKTIYAAVPAAQAVTSYQNINHNINIGFHTEEYINTNHDPHRHALQAFGTCLWPNWKNNDLNVYV